MSLLEFAMIVTGNVSLLASRLNHAGLQLAGSEVVIAPGVRPLTFTALVRGVLCVDRQWRWGCARRQPLRDVDGKAHRLRPHGPPYRHVH
jgi:hypothetical protein